MEELVELRAHIEQGRYAEALSLIGEMEEMSRDDKRHKIGSFLYCGLLRNHSI
jgi:pentatricopeptide repeat protein